MLVFLAAFVIFPLVGIGLPFLTKIEKNLNDFTGGGKINQDGVSENHLEVIS